MHRAVARRRCPPIAGTDEALEVRLLWHTVTVDGAPEVVGQLATLLATAEHPMPPRRHMHYTVAREGTGFRVFEEGDVVAPASDALSAADVVQVRAHRRAFELASLSGWVRVRAATVDLENTRVLIVGPPGAGTTTLAARLLLDGADVQGAESVLVRRAASLAVPGALRLKVGYERWLPELDRFRARLPTVGDATLLDPVRVGRSWRLREAPIEHVVLLGEPGGPGGPADGGAVLEALLAGAFPVTETKAGMVATLAGAIARARGHRLARGAPSAMAETLRRTVG